MGLTPLRSDEIKGVIRDAKHRLVATRRLIANVGVTPIAHAAEARTIAGKACRVQVTLLPVEGRQA
jgi:hypothetical protein